MGAPKHNGVTFINRKGKQRKERTMLYEPIDGSGSPHIHRNNYKSPLAPISEVRKVTFAAQYIRDELDNSYTAVDVVRVKFIPHLVEYSKSERRNTWYTSDEIKTMKHRAFRDIDVRKDEMKQNRKRPAHNQLLYSGDVRGLERLVYNDTNVCAKLRYDALCALIQEQHEQRYWMYSNHNPGGIMHPQDAFLDDERIRHVVMTVGKSILSEKIAIKLAMNDEIDADLYLNRKHKAPQHQVQTKEHHEKKETKKSKSQHQRKNSYHEEYHEKVLSPMMGRKMGSKGSKDEENNCCWCVDVVEQVGKSLLLHAMLSPVMKLQRGDALLVE